MKIFIYTYILKYKTIIYIIFIYEIKPNFSCNVMITWSCHVSLTLGLYVTGWFHLSLLHRLRYELFFKSSHCHYNLISLVPTWQPISTSFFWSRKSYASHVSQISSLLWSSAHEKRLLADKRLSGSGGGGARGVSSHSIKESH